MLDQLIVKLIGSITEPLQLVMLLWILFCIVENRRLHDVNDRLLDAQQERGVVMAKLTVMIERIFDATTNSVPSKKEG